MQDRKITRSGATKNYLCLLGSVKSVLAEGTGTQGSQQQPGSSWDVLVFSRISVQPSYCCFPDVYYLSFTVDYIELMDSENMLWERFIQPHFIAGSFSVGLCGYKLEGIDYFKISPLVREYELWLQNAIHCLEQAEKRRLRMPKCLNIYTWR